MQNLKEHAEIIISAQAFINIAFFAYIWRSLLTAIQKIETKQDKATEDHHKCQRELSERFVGKADFTQFLQVRAADHAMINSRLHSLETQLANLATKIDLFMDDSTKKVERLSSTFIAKEGEISQRIDRIAERMNHSEAK